MAQGSEMLYGLANSVMVVDLEDADSRTVGAYVDEDHWNLALGELIEQWLRDGPAFGLCAHPLVKGFHLVNP